MTKSSRNAKSSRRCWLIKSEPNCYSIDDLARDQITAWSGVRNYQARNFMRDEMKIGDPVLFYHSSTEPIGVAGLAEVASVARPDMSAFDPTDQFFDPKSKPENPSWVVVDIKFVAKLPKLVPLADLKSRAELAQMMVCQRGNRPSVQPVDPKHFSLIKKLGGL